MVLHKENHNTTQGKEKSKKSNEKNLKKYTPQ